MRGRSRVVFTHNSSTRRHRKRRGEKLPSPEGTLKISLGVMSLLKVYTLVRDQK